MIVFIGIGSNLENPIQQVQTALDEMHDITDCQFIARSSLYQSAPLGVKLQPDYINAVAKIDTKLEAVVLLQALQLIEQKHGRVRGSERWQSRTLDLDILLYGDLSIDQTSLTIPHPDIDKRNFVLIPLYEIDPGIMVPGKGPVAKLVQNCPPGMIEKLNIAEASPTRT